MTSRFMADPDVLVLNSFQFQTIDESVMVFLKESNGVSRIHMDLLLGFCRKRIWQFVSSLGDQNAVIVHTQVARSLGEQQPYP